MVRSVLVLLKNSPLLETLGATLIVTGVVGLAGWWVGAIVAGGLLVLKAFDVELDRRE